MDFWNGFKLERKTVAGREALIVLPEKGTENGKWALKTEYFDAFPDVQIRLLKLGYHVAHIKTVTRWHITEDTDAQAELARYMVEKYFVSKKCVIIGMSCGGMQGIYFAARYPEYVSCMYLDAPVINLLSCPCGLGKATNDLYEGFVKDTGFTIDKLISYRNHPLDNIDKLIEKNIPVFLCCGDIDTVVPFEENGMLLKKAYEENNCIIKTVIKKGCGHHPHSLADNTPIIDFILEYDK